MRLRTSEWVMYKVLFAVLLIAVSTQFAIADVGITLNPIAIEGFAGLQSFAVGRHGARVVLIGGRTDGLHRRQPSMAFDAQGEPQVITVLDLEQRRMWTASLTGLPSHVLDQWTSTNACFVQSDSLLVIIGGYGIASSGQGHRTHPVWSVVHVGNLIDAVIAKRSFTHLISSGTGDAFAITGGRAGMFGDTIITVGGHRFDGRYNPMGGSSFTQAYTNAIRRFTLDTASATPRLSYVNETVDPLNLHRRDFNVVAQIFPDGSHGYTAFSGVFQIGVDLPYLTLVDIHHKHHAVVDEFEQRLAHYHCGTVPVFNTRDSVMHTFFLGGIAQFYATRTGAIERDDSVPFVNTISRVSRARDGSLSEYRLRDTMPGFLGAGSEVVLRDQPGRTPHDVLSLRVDAESHNTLVGWVIGGIQSTAPNIFWTNDGSQSNASPFIAEIRLSAATTSVYIAPADARREDPVIIEVRLYNDSVEVIAQDLTPEAEIGLFDINGRNVGGQANITRVNAVTTATISTLGLSSGTYVAFVLDSERTATKLVQIVR